MYYGSAGIGDYDAELAAWQEAKRKYDEYVSAARGVGPRNASLSAHVAPLNRKAKEQNGLAPDAYPNDFCVSQEIKDYAKDVCESQTSIRGLGLTMFAMVSGKPPPRLYQALKDAAYPDCVIAAMPTCPTLVKAPAPVPNPGPMPQPPRGGSDDLFVETPDDADDSDEDSSNLAIYGVLALLVVAGGGYAYYRYRKVA